MKTATTSLTSHNSSSSRRSIEEDMGEVGLSSEEAMKYVWGGAIPLQIQLDPSEVTSIPPPPPALVLGPRIGYLPLLVPLVKPHFDAALPPGIDSVWFDYKGLPLKWYIPIGVLFDLLCLEPERPWNLTVHFRGYPSELIIPCEGEDDVKWSFINSLKEAAYIMNGNCKNIMNMSQADQLELWQSVLKGNMESYLRISSKLRLGPLGEDCLLKKPPGSQPRAGHTEAHGTSNQMGRIPIKLYVRYVLEEVEDLNDADSVDTWDDISYINRPIEIHKEGRYLTLQTAVERLLPDISNGGPAFEETFSMKGGSPESCSNSDVPEETTGKEKMEEQLDGGDQHEGLVPIRKSRIKLVRIQGIDPGLAVPLAWVVNSLANPESFLHICVFVASDEA